MHEPPESNSLRAKAKKLPKVLPKAPQSDEVAQRLLRNSTIRPVQRFDSADYFLEQWEQQQQTLKAQHEPILPRGTPVEEAIQPPVALMEEHDQLQKPPPLSSRTSFVGDSLEQGLNAMP